MIFVDKSVVRERNAICNTCEFKRGDFKKQIDELKSQVSSLAIKETVKMPSRSDEIRRMF